MKVKICAVQCRVFDTFDRNISRVEHYFKAAKKKNCDIICFPELFLKGWLRKKHYNPKHPSEAKEVFSGLCKKYSMHAIMGTILENKGKNFYNISYLFDDNGSIIGNYKKSHLVQSESVYIKPGNGVKVFKTKLGNIGIQICRDLLYPEITRKLMLKGAEIVFCPSFWCSRSSSYSAVYNDKYFGNKVPDEVTMLVSARAIESEVIFVYVNAAGTYNYLSDNLLLGKTQVAVPFYGTVNSLKNNRESILVSEVDLSIVKDAKKVYRISKDLKNYYRI